LRWTRQRQARGSDRRAVLTVSEHGAQTNGADPYGKTVWSWHQLLVSSWRRFAKPDRAPICRGGCCPGKMVAGFPSIT